MRISDNPNHYISQGDQRAEEMNEWIAAALDGTAADSHLLEEMLDILHAGSYDETITAMRVSQRAGRCICSIAYQYLIDRQAQVFARRPDLVQLYQAE